jgi:hypothetical protein
MVMVVGLATGTLETSSAAQLLGGLLTGVMGALVIGSKTNESIDKILNGDDK